MVDFTLCGIKINFWQAPLANQASDNAAEVVTTANSEKMATDSKIAANSVGVINGTRCRPCNVITNIPGALKRELGNVASKIVDCFVECLFANQLAEIKKYVEAPIPSTETILYLAESFPAVEIMIGRKIDMQKVGGDNKTIFQTACARRSWSSGGQLVIKRMIESVPVGSAFEVLKLLTTDVDCIILGKDTTELYKFLATTDRINVASLSPEEQMLLWQICSFSTQKLAFLKKRGLDINIRDKQGLTPLLALVSKNVRYNIDTKLVRLLAMGADPLVTWKHKGLEYTVLTMPWVDEKGETNQYTPTLLKPEDIESLNKIFKQMGIDDKLRKLQEEVDGRNADFLASQKSDQTT